MGETGCREVIARSWDVSMGEDIIPQLRLSQSNYPPGAKFTEVRALIENLKWRADARCSHRVSEAIKELNSLLELQEKYWKQ